MSSLEQQIKSDPRRREMRPERIDLGDGDEAVRNDVIAKGEGVSERTLNRGDAEGDPFLMFGGVKYRPLRRHQEFRRTQIQIRNQPQRRSRRAQMLAPR